MNPCDVFWLNRVGVGRLLADFLPRKYYFGRVWVENFDNFAEISIFVVYLHGHLKRGFFMAF